MKLAQKIVSLPRGTCCYRAACKLKELMDESVEIIQIHSFFAAKHQIEENLDLHDALFLVPDINEINPLLTQSPNWTWSDSIKIENPRLYLAKSRISPTPANAGRCYSIPALRPLLENDEHFETIGRIPGFTFYDTDSTYTAAETVAEGGAGYCITNEECLNHFDLSKVIQLKHMSIIWKFFKYSPKLNTK